MDLRSYITFDGMFRNNNSISFYYMHYRLMGDKIVFNDFINEYKGLHSTYIRVH